MAAMVTRVGDVIKSSFKNVILVPSVAVALAGFAPPYLATWVIWRGATAFLPQWVYQVGDDFLYYLYQNAVLFFFEYISGVQVFFDGDAEEIFAQKENAIYLGNHQSTVDWVLSNMVAVRQGSLGNLRYVMKSSLQQLPLYGLYFYEHGCIYVNRGNFDQRKMINSLSYLQHPKINTCMVVFPEGTRFGLARKTDSSHRRDANSDAFVRVPGNGDSASKSNGLAVDEDMKPVSSKQRVELRHHLTPKSKGTWLALQTLRKQTKAIYSVSVVYEGCVDSQGNRKVAPQILGFLKRECKWVYLHLKRIPIEDVPNNETEFQAWLDQLFVRKDKIVEDFYSTDPEVRAKALERGKPARSRFMAALLGVAAMSAVTVPFFLSSAGQSLYWKVAIFGSLIGYSRLALAAVA